MERLLARLWNAVLTGALVAGQAVVSLRYNWGIGLLAVVLAISLWVFVTERENPERTGDVPGSVPIEWVNIPPGLALAPPCERSVTVRARAPESVLERLTAEDFRATVELSQVTGREATVPVRVVSEESRAQVVGQSPQQMRVQLEDAVSRDVPVAVSILGSPASGLEQEAITVEPEEVVVSGPQSQVSRVESVEAEVNLSGARSTVEQTTLLQPRVGTGLLECVDVEPASATVQAEIVQVEFSSRYVVLEDISGLPAEGFSVVGTEVDPPTVVLTGPLETLQSIDAVGGIETETVSIEGATDVVVRPAALILPPGVRADPPTVTVQVRIAAQSQLSLRVPPRAINVAGNLEATLQRRAVQVNLVGTEAELNALAASAVRATVDLAGLGAGEHSVPVVVATPAGIAVVSVTPAQVTVTLQPP